jgi:hypothetical protein
MITFACTTCRQTLSVPEANGGKKGKCPQCGSIIDIPMTSAPEPLAPVPPPPISGPTDYAAAHLEPIAGDTSESFVMKPAMEFVVPSFVLASVAFIASGYAPSLRALPGGAFPAVIMGLASLGISGFALFLAILGLLKAMAQRQQGSWYIMSALVLSGASVFVSLMMFIASFTVKNLYEELENSRRRSEHIERVEPADRKI